MEGGKAMAPFNVKWVDLEQGSVIATLEDGEVRVESFLNV